MKLWNENAHWGILTKVSILSKIPISIPHLLCFLFSRNRHLIVSDIKARSKLRNYIIPGNLQWSLCLVLLEEKEFRNQFYVRIGRPSHFLKILLPEVSSCDLGRCKNIGKGFSLIHGFNVVINGNAIIGHNVTVLQGVTIGGGKNGAPQIGNNVYIGAGAIIIGGIHIGNNVKIGAGAIVVDDVPDNSTVVNIKARIIRRD